MSLTARLDLRSGTVCWPERDDLTPDPLPSQTVDVAIVGAGVMGAMIAERLTRAGRSVAIMDRRPPARGATAASTALVMWAADTPLGDLAKTWGDVEAARRWRRVHAAVLDLAHRITATGLACGWTSRPEVYLAGDILGDDALRREARTRREAGLPSDFLGPEEVAARFGLPPRAGLLSADAFEVDPIALTQGLLAVARRLGATLTWPVDIVGVTEATDRIGLHTADGGVLTARHVVLATGYEAARGYLPNAFRLGSSYAIATASGAAPLWTGDALIWEAADPYLYARATADGRVIVGGEDEDFADPRRRDALLPSKAQTLARRGADLLGVATLQPDCAWTATFGGSPDGLPAIGLARGHQRLWLAAGFGGNGVTFASLGAAIIAAALADAPDPDAECFSPYRFG